jgi:hypothetical protein
MGLLGKMHPSCQKSNSIYFINVARIRDVMCFKRSLRKRINPRENGVNNYH